MSEQQGSSTPGAQPTPSMQPAPEQPAGRSAANPARAALRFIAQHPIGILEFLFFVLVAVVILQNLEPTSFQVLFWSFPSLPKVVALVATLLAGGLLWEILRRLLFRKRS